MTLEFNGHRFTVENVDPIVILFLLGDKVDKRIANDIAKPDFYIVVRPVTNPKSTAKRGDYDIVIRKADGKEITLDMPHRGAKMIYVLRLLTQKVVEGLTNKYFCNARSLAAITSLYDKLFRSGGEQWVDSCATNKHNLSTFRTHAKSAVLENKSLDSAMRYWCNFENEKWNDGRRALQLRRVRIPNERIIFEDAVGSRVSFEQIMEQLPSLKELFRYRNKNADKLRELREMH